MESIGLTKSKGYRTTKITEGHSIVPFISDALLILSNNFTNCSSPYLRFYLSITLQAMWSASTLLKVHGISTPSSTAKETRNSMEWHEAGISSQVYYQNIKRFSSTYRQNSNIVLLRAVQKLMWACEKQY